MLCFQRLRLTSTFGAIRMRLPILSISLFSALVLSVGCGRQEASLSRQRICVCGATNWFRVTCGMSSFSAMMPPRPTTSIATNETGAGPLVMTMVTSEPSRMVAFSILHNSFPTKLPLTDTERLFSGGLRQALGADGHLVSERAISLDGSPGKEWCFDKYRGQAIVTMRAYLVGHDFYQAISVMPRSRVCTRHIAGCLESCQLRNE